MRDEESRGTVFVEQLMKLKAITLSGGIRRDHPSKKPGAMFYESDEEELDAESKLKPALGSPKVTVWQTEPCLMLWVLRWSERDLVRRPKTLARFERPWANHAEDRLAWWEYSVVKSRDGEADVLFSRDGKWLAVLESNHSITLLRVADGKQSQLVTPQSELRPKSIAFGLSNEM